MTPFRELLQAELVRKKGITSKCQYDRFDILKTIAFPKIEVPSIDKFIQSIKK